MDRVRYMRRNNPVRKPLSRACSVLLGQMPNVRGNVRARTAFLYTWFTCEITCRFINKYHF